MNQENTLVYSVAEVAALLGIGRSKAYELVRSGTIPSLRLGRRIVIPKLALSRLLAECAHQNADEADHQQPVLAQAHDQPHGHHRHGHVDGADADRGQELRRLGRKARRREYLRRVIDARTAAGRARRTTSASSLGVI